MGASNSDVDSGSPGGGGSRKKRPTREEMTAIRAPGQRNQAGGKSGVGMGGRGRIVSATPTTRPKEPGGNADRAPSISKPQRAYESIQELRKRRDNPQLPGMLSGIATRSLNDQIKKLQEGGTPVMSGTMTVGVISQGGSYTGRPEYGDFARSQYRTAGAEIRVPIGGARMSGDSERATTSATAPSTPVKSITGATQPPTGLGSEDAARRAMIQGAAGSATRRRYIR